MRNDAERTTQLTRRRSRRTSATLEPRLDDDGHPRERREDVVSREKMLWTRGARIGQAREESATRSEYTIEERDVLERIRAIEPSTRDDDRGAASLERSLVRRRVDAKRTAGPDGEPRIDEVVHEQTRESARLGARHTTTNDGDARRGRKSSTQVQGRRRTRGGGERTKGVGISGRIGRKDERGGHTRPSTERGGSCARSCSGRFSGRA